MENTSIRLAAFDCLTAFGDVVETHRALSEGQRAIQLRPVLGSRGGDLVPLALCPGRSLDETAPPQWIGYVQRLAQSIPQADWGSPRRPVFVTSSNFGVGNLYAYRQTRDAAHLTYGTPSSCIDWLSKQLGWGPNVSTFSHACVSAHLGLLQATRLLRAELADEVLVFSYDFLSPFVAGGFNALKILNSDFPAPYENRATGSIALGDGLAFAVLSRDHGDFQLSGQTLHNEMYHFTANQSDGLGFAACIQTVKSAAADKRVWLKGHGTGTLDAGRLESKALCDAFPDSPLVAWKGSLGHTLGSCGLVELAIAAQAIDQGVTPGTVGSTSEGFSENVAFASFSNRDFDGAVCTSNAFGGAHAALLLTRA